MLYLMMTLVTASGLMLAAQLKPIAVTYGYDKYALFGGFTVLTLTLSVNQILNGSARPFFGWVSDRIGRYDTMAIVFVLEAITIVALTLLVARPFWFITISALMFFAWGDITRSFPRPSPTSLEASMRPLITEFNIRPKAWARSSPARGPRC